MQEFSLKTQIVINLQKLVFSIKKGLAFGGKYFNCQIQHKKKERKTLELKRFKPQILKKNKSYEGKKNPK